MSDTVSVPIPTDLHKQLEEAAKENATTVEEELARHLNAGLSARTNVPSKKGGRPPKRGIDALYDRMINWLVLAEVLKRPKKRTVSQTIARISKQKPFEGQGDLRRRYQRFAKEFRARYGLQKMPYNYTGGVEITLGNSKELCDPREVLEALTSLRIYQQRGGVSKLLDERFGHLSKAQRDLASATFALENAKRMRWLLLKFTDEKDPDGEKLVTKLTALIQLTQEYIDRKLGKN